MALLGALKDLRNRLIANPRFRRWAAAFPLTRGVARRRARALFDLAAGFVYSQTLAACVHADLFSFLADGPRDIEAIAGRAGLPREGADRLARAAAALGLLEARGAERYALGPLGAAMIGNPGVAEMVRHHGLLYADLADPLALLRGEPAERRLAAFWPYADAPGDADPEAAAVYSALMAASQPMIAEQALAAAPVAGRRRILDVGGGEGAFLEAVAARAPDAELVLFDLPAAAARAEARFAEAGLSERARAIGGDFFADPLPGGADLITLVRILHDHPDEDAMRVLRAARAAIAPGGRLMVAEPMAETPGAEPAGDAYFGFYLLAMGKGRPRSAARLKEMIRQAGFRRPREAPTPTPLLARVLTADASEAKS